jgi:hypothetical protein
MAPDSVSAAKAVLGQSYTEFLAAYYFGEAYQFSKQSSCAG